MSWYVAHMIVALIPKKYQSGAIGVYENFILLNADDCKSAADLAVSYGKSENNFPTESFIDGSKVREKFIGIRKVVSILNQDPILKADKDPPAHLTELTYSEYLLPNIREVKKLAHDKTVAMVYSGIGRKKILKKLRKIK